MPSIVNDRFAEYLSEQNKEQMMRICGPVAAAEAAAEALPQKEKGFFSSLFNLGGRKMKRSNKRSNKRYRRSKSDKKYKGGGGGSPPSYIGSTQGKYMILNGKQLMTNPAGGIA